MWDFSFAIPSLLILGILLFNYFMLQRLPIKINKSFVILLFTETVVITSDIVGSWACDEYASLPRFFVFSTNMVYFIAFAFRGFIFFRFTCETLGLDPSENKFRTFLCQLPLIFCEIIVLSTPWTNAIFYVGTTGYKRGYLYHSITYTFIFYVGLGLFAVLNYKQNLKRLRQKYGVIIYHLMLVLGLIFRQLMPQFLLMDTFCIMGILTINLCFMNPDFYIERRTRLFNTAGLQEFLEEKSTQKYTQIFGFVINHYLEDVEIYSTKQMDAGINLIGAYLRRSFPHLLHFYYRSGRFILIAKDNVDVDDVIATIEGRFKKPWISNNVELYLDVSFAKILCDWNRYDTESVISVLANALVIANSSTNELINIDDDMFQATHETTKIKAVLENAIKTNSVEVFLQPIVDAQTLKLVGAESLARIRDEKGNIIPPGKFISLAEKNGRINQLGEQVFEKTCRFVKSNDLKSMGMKWVNVNISTAQFMKKDLAKSFEILLNKYNVSPDSIHLEITEVAIIDESLMKDQINEIQKRGFAFSLDDYGTGYSNVSRLKHYPFTNVKLDMSLVWDHCKKPDIILPMLVKTLKGSGYTITAEGIETIEMAKAMAEIGCDYLQGWYFSPPIPMNDFINKYKSSS